MMEVDCPPSLILGVRMPMFRLRTSLRIERYLCAPTNHFEGNIITMIYLAEPVG